METETQKQINDLKQQVNKLNDLFFRMYQNDKFFLEKPIVLQYGTLYVDNVGDLYFKTKAGVATKLN